MAAVGRLLRTHTLNTGGFGDSGSNDGLILPWYCQQDEAHTIKWYHQSLGVPPCSIPEHLLKGGHKMSLDEELTEQTHGLGIIPDLKTTLGL